MQRRKHHRRRFGRGTLVLLVVLGLLLAGGAGSALAAYRFDRARVGRILPGVRIAGVDVGDMTRSQALRAVSTGIEGRLTQHVTVTSADRTWNPTTAELGLWADVKTAVDRALSLSQSYSWVARTYHRLADRPVSRSLTVAMQVDASKIQDFVGMVAASVKKRARDASFTLSGGKVERTHAATGQVLRTGESESLLLDAASSGVRAVTLPVEVVKPKVPDRKIGHTIVVDVSKNQLHLYDGFKVERTYPVATAKPGFLTPDGSWEVVQKVENPTWHNPAPDGWGAGEPLVIPPGPTNPLGTRALYLNAPGIRIHGTPDSSSVGTYASHGCIRMHISDSEALYPLVAVGTPVFIIGAPPWGITSTPGPAG